MTFAGRKGALSARTPPYVSMKSECHWNVRTPYVPARAESAPAAAMYGEWISSTSGRSRAITDRIFPRAMSRW